MGQGKPCSPKRIQSVQYRHLTRLNMTLNQEKNRLEQQIEELNKQIEELNEKIKNIESDVRDKQLISDEKTVLSRL